MKTLHGFADADANHPDSTPLGEKSRLQQPLQQDYVGLSFILWPDAAYCRHQQPPCRKEFSSVRPQVRICHCNRSRQLCQQPSCAPSSASSNSPAAEVASSLNCRCHQDGNLQPPALIGMVSDCGRHSRHRLVLRPPATPTANYISSVPTWTGAASN